MVTTTSESASQGSNTCLGGYIMMYINYTEASFFWKDTVLNSGKRQHFVEMWSKIDFLYTWLLRMSLSH